MTYNEFILNIIDTRGQWNIPEGEYFEKHHILPVCLGGTGDYESGKFKKYSLHENCIWLKLDEHYEAHKLLALENLDNYKLVYAFKCMSSTRDGLCIDTSDEYKILREAFIKYDSELNTGKPSLMKGKHFDKEFCDKVSRLTKLAMTPEVCLKISEACKGRLPWNKGKTDVYSDESLLKMSIAKKGKPLSEEHRRHVGEAELGHEVSYETRLKISKALSGINCKRNRRVICLETGEVFYNAKTAAELMNLNHGNLIQVCKNNRLQIKGYHFEYYTDGDNIIEGSEDLLITLI